MARTVAGWTGGFKWANAPMEVDMTGKRLIGTMFSLSLLVGTTPAWAAEHGTAEEAKALLQRAVAEVQADRLAAMEKFNKGEDGFKDRDLYIFCFEADSGMEIAGVEAFRGKDVRTLRDPTGKAFGEEMYERASEGEILEVDYMFPLPGTTEPVPKHAFVTKIGRDICGVGIYK